MMVYQIDVSPDWLLSPPSHCAQLTVLVLMAAWLVVGLFDVRTSATSCPYRLIIYNGITL
jgi:hypothetical protein